MKHVDLEKFANGAFSAQVNRAIEEVTENIQNLNTDAGATRKITVTIAFKPNAERNFVASYYDQERFLIELQANFVETADLITIMQVAGNIKSGTTANYSDDGVSQKTTIKTGVELADVIVPNPVKLRPYRTFAEIEQPESSYVFRIKDAERGPAFKLVEADGGLWKNAVMKKIKEYLEFELSEELEKHKITVIA